MKKKIKRSTNGDKKRKEVKVKLERIKERKSRIEEERRRNELKMKLSEMQERRNRGS